LLVLLKLPFHLHEVQQQANLCVHEIAHVSRKPQSGFAAEMGFTETVNLN